MYSQSKRTDLLLSVDRHELLSRPAIDDPQHADGGVLVLPVSGPVLKFIVVEVVRHEFAFAVLGPVVWELLLVAEVVVQGLRLALVVTAAGLGWAARVRRVVPEVVHGVQHGCPAVDYHLTPRPHGGRGVGGGALVGAGVWCGWGGEGRGCESAGDRVEDHRPGAAAALARRRALTVAGHEHYLVT